jgi:hypothetical protein
MARRDTRLHPLPSTQRRIFDLAHRLGERTAGVKPATGGARLGLDVPEKERDEIAAAAHVVEDMVARLRPAGGRDVAVEPAHVVRFPEG